jgi:hypothetical protein
MLAVRKLWTILVAAWAGAFLARAVLDWVLGQEGTWVAVAIVAAAVLGGLAGVSEAKGVEPLDPAERRDTILGWGALIGGVAAVACLFLPLPWGVLAAAGVVMLTVVLLRRVPKPRAERSGTPTRG